MSAEIAPAGCGASPALVLEMAGASSSAGCSPGGRFPDLLDTHATEGGPAGQLPLKDHGARHLRGPAIRGTHSLGQGRETRDGLVARPHAGAQAPAGGGDRSGQQDGQVDLGDACEGTGLSGSDSGSGLSADRYRYAGDVRRSRRNANDRQIGIRKPACFREPRARYSDVDLIRVSPYRPAAMVSAATEGLTHERTRSHARSRSRNQLASKGASTQ